MKWWQDIWLNEGFASFMENVGTDVAEPGWAMNEQLIIEKIQPALELDGLLSSHPISVPVNNPADIEALFDTISYKKVRNCFIQQYVLMKSVNILQGSAIISMLEVCIGKDILQAGLQNYLNENRYGNADTEDLWIALSRAAAAAKSSINVKVVIFSVSVFNVSNIIFLQEVMDTWILQAGYPLVSVQIGGSSVHASQARYLDCLDDNITDPNSPLNNTLGYKWHVPLTYISSVNNETPKLIWMNMTDGKGSKHYVFFYNSNLYFSRVRYSKRYYVD